ncbi:MAG: hypothetical protein ACYDBB_10060 [Armatimonadota bacterium]
MYSKLTQTGWLLAVLPYLMMSVVAAIPHTHAIRAASDAKQVVTASLPFTMQWQSAVLVENEMHCTVCRWQAGSSACLQLPVELLPTSSITFDCPYAAWQGSVTLAFTYPSRAPPACLQQTT